MDSKSSKNGPVVIIGGGFGGLNTALSLSIGKYRPPIVLIEPRARFVFLPLLYELLSGELEAWEVAPTYQSLLASRGISHFVDNVEKIDLQKKVVITSGGQEIDYSQLVISTGSKVDSYGIEGVCDHALTFNKFEDVSKVKKLIQKLNSSKKQNLVIVGAGATGVELACKIGDLINDSSFIHLVEIGDRALPYGKSFNQDQIIKALKTRSIKLHLQSKVLRVTNNQLHILNLDGKRLDPFRLDHAGVIWTAGVKPSIPYGLPDHLLKEGKVLIDSQLQVIGYENVYAIGDIALDLENPLASNAQVAMQQGQHLAENLLGFFEGKTSKPFQFVDRGEMLSMGIGEATITGMGITISGLIAFQMRRMAYLSKFPNFSLVIRSFGAWLLSYGNKF